MLHGRFGNSTGRPYIEGRLSIPRFGVIGNISLLLDTGADKSVLMPVDAERFGIDYRQLLNPIDMHGIGSIRGFVEPAILAFADPGCEIFVYEIDLHIAAPNPSITKTPSLLGRDILNDWVITLD